MPIRFLPLRREGRLLSGCLLALLLVAIPAVRAETVVFSEIMYNPPGAEPEFVELYNNTATPFDIANWQLKGGVDFEFPSFDPAAPARTFLNAFERIVLSSADESTTRAAYNIPANVRIYGPWSGNLSNGGERITLEDKNSTFICTVEYRDRGKWQIAADGAGHTLVLRDGNRAVDDWRNWTASKRRFGTPGTNPIAAAETPVANPEIDARQGIVLVDFPARWKYLRATSDPGTSWREWDFPDTQWFDGPGLLGFEGSALPAPGLQTPFTTTSQLAYYFRTEFNYSGSLQNIQLAIDQIIDDGAVYYLNGAELGRSGIDPGVVVFSTPANRTVSNATLETDVISVAGTALRSGRNVLAAEVHQINTGSTDLVLGARLRALVTTQAGVVINEVLPGSSGIGFVEFYNPLANAINLRGYYLTDDPGTLTKFRIATDVIVPARGFASVGFAESGLSQANPVRVYLVGTDGSSVVNGFSASFPGDGRSIGRKPAGGSEWFMFTEPTRNGPNASSDSLNGFLALNEAHFTSTNTVDWIELFNSADTAMSLDGLFIASTRDSSDKIALAGQIGAGGFKSIDVNFPLSGGEVSVFVVNSAGTVIDAQLLGRPRVGSLLQAFPDGGKHWYSTTNPTRDVANAPQRNRDVVINEIMFDPPSDQLDGEFIELFNRGSAAVDVSLWEFVDGVSVTIPAGTTIQAGAYLVVAADAARMRRIFPTAPVVGNFTGRLANNGDLIRLVDQFGNLVDEVDYRTGGDWPSLTKGDGSSMELVNPWMDNDLPSAWRDSDESNKAPFVDYSYAAIYRQITTLGGPTDYRELHFHLVGDAYMVLRDIQLIKLTAGTNLIVKGTQMSTNGYSASGWLAQGTHWATHLEGSDLHLIADGRGDNRPNRCEIDLPGIAANDNCELRFKARWVHGNPRLIAQTWDHSIATSIRVEVPENLGTPGTRNSRYAAATPPQIDRVLHSPAVPKASQDVKITARLGTIDPLRTVEVVHRRATATLGAWQSKPMFDDGASGGDEVAGDGIYTALLTEHKQAGAIVQFYVSAATTSSAGAVLPKGGANRPALYVVDDRSIPRDMRTARFVVSPYDLEAISNGDTLKHSYKFPRLSNHYKNATFISNEDEIFYNAEIHNAGSPWTRDGSLNRAKWKLPGDRMFRNQDKFAYDNEIGGGAMTHNRVARHLLYLMGHPVNDNEFIRVVINTSGADMREDTEPVSDYFLDRIEPNGSEGDLYQIEDEFWFTDTWQRTQADATWGYKNTENAGRYRTAWMKRTNEEQDDFSALVGFFRTVTRPYTQNQIERVIDPHASMQMAVVRGYISDWDNFTENRGKNGFFYRRPSDGKFQFLHWDSDLTFGDTTMALYGSFISGWLTKPYNKRLFYSYLVELIENYTRGSARMNAWFQAEENTSPAYSANMGFYQSWFNNRLRTCTNSMGVNYTRAFDITTNGGAPIETSEDTVSLTGMSPYGVIDLNVEGHPEAEVLWTSDIAWTINGIRVKSGENVLRVTGVNQWGAIIKEDSIAVTKTGNARPVVSLDSDPEAWRVLTGDTFTIDAGDSFDPDATPLSFNWSINPATGVSFNTNLSARATARFARPGLYTVNVGATDQSGSATQAAREIAVHGPAGFSPFNDRLLEGHWRFENVEYRDNYSPGSWLSLVDAPGNLTLQVTDDAARPPIFSRPAYPFIWRELPQVNEWSLHTKVELTDRRFGDFVTGLMVETIESGARRRYSFGIVGGSFLGVLQLNSDGSTNSLASAPANDYRATLRVRRNGTSLFFEQRLQDLWSPVHIVSLPAGSSVPKGGIFTATTAPQAVRSAFDYVMLVNPSETSALRDSVRITEIMYNPIGGESFEYVELMNIGLAAADLTGAKFTNGITFTFGATQLAAGEQIVVVKDVAAFTSRYGAAVRIAAGVFSGRLDNGGETLTLVDKNDELIAEVKYDDEGAWPERPDGFGSSLEVIDVGGDPNNADNWRASAEYNGSPGQAGLGPVKNIVVNEVLAHSDPPLEDAIELHNLTSAEVSISGWFLSDSRAALQKYRIPTPMIVPANGYVVFYENQFNTNNTLVPFSLSSAMGDEVYLTEADASGNPVRFADNVSFGATENGISLGRYPNGAGDLTAMSELTFGTDVKRTDPPERNAQFITGRGAPNAYPRVGPVVITEIMYNPATGGDEFIEFRNITSTNVPLFHPQFPDNKWIVGGAIDHVFPGMTLPAGSRVILASIDPAAFRTKYAVPAEVAIVGPFAGSLDNSGETIQLLKPDAPQTLPPNEGFVPYIVVEKVRYDNDPPWPSAADGGGPSLKRQVLTAFGNDPSNWGTSRPNEDTDGDGMPDEWENQHSLDRNLAADATQDPDGDGLSNLDEFNAGTNPRDASSTFGIATVSRVGNNVSLTFTAVAGRTYSVLYSDRVPGNWQTLTDVPAQPTTATVNITDPDAAGLTRFYQLVTPALP